MFVYFDEQVILMKDMWADLCLFVHSSRSMQHLCSGLERIFLRIPSSQFPMKYDGEMNEKDFLDMIMEIF